MGECHDEKASAPATAAEQDSTQFFAVPAVGAPVPYAVPSELVANFTNQPMYVMVPLTALQQQQQ